MSRITLSGNPSGTGTFTIASPNSNTDRTLNLPDNSGTVLTSASSIAASQLGAQFSVSASAPSNSLVMDASGRITVQNQPAFQVVGADSGSFSGGAQIPFTDAVTSSAVFNIGGHWSNANDRFTAPVAGKYLFYAGIYYQNASSTFGSIAPRVNGAQLTAVDTFLLFDGGTVNLGTSDNQIKGTFIFNLAANDYVDIATRTGSPALTIYAGHTFFGGYLLG